jgi:hypothetical protein
MHLRLRGILMSGIFLLTAAVTSQAQSADDTASAESRAFDSLMTTLEASEDTSFEAAVVAAEPMPLLPARLGPMESLLWSERGWMRRAFDYPLTPEGREKEFGARRNLLALHQIGGFATLAALAATVALGQLTYNGNEGLAGMHAPMAYTAVTLYFTTATLALFTPPPAIRRGEWSTISTHKLLATIHFSGMALTPFLGRMVADNRRDLRTIHLTSAYVTTATFAGAMLVVMF